MTSVAVFCSASPDIAPLLLSEAEQVGEALAQLGFKVIFGGTSTGMMGKLADGVSRFGGELIGVVPDQVLFTRQIYPRLSEEWRVATLGERKQKMFELADLFLVLPGGVGTLDELFDSWAIQTVMGTQKPTLIYNEFEFYRPLLDALELLLQSRMIRPAQMNLLRPVSSQSDLRTFLLGFQQSDFDAALTSI